MFNLNLGFLLRLLIRAQDSGQTMGQSLELIRARKSSLGHLTERMPKDV